MNNSHNNEMPSASFGESAEGFSIPSQSITISLTGLKYDGTDNSEEFLEANE